MALYDEIYPIMKIIIATLIKLYRLYRKFYRSADKSASILIVLHHAFCLNVAESGQKNTPVVSLSPWWFSRLLSTIKKALISVCSRANLNKTQCFREENKHPCQLFCRVLGRVWKSSLGLKKPERNVQMYSAVLFGEECKCTCPGRPWCHRLAPGLAPWRSLRISSALRHIVERLIWARASSSL